MCIRDRLYTLLAYDLDSYIDWETGKCSFDSEDFQKVLEFVNTFPEEYDWQNDDRSTPAKIQSGEVLLNMTGIYQLNSIQEEEAMFLSLIHIFFSSIPIPSFTLP